MKTIAQLLRNEIGLDPLSIGEGALERVARHRTMALGLSSLDQYRSLAHTSLAELKELIEAVVISETWFFRESAAFAALARHLSASLADRKPARPFRILSLPCSSGEEPYSIVMTLTEAGIPKSAYSVDAVDISARSLQKARRGGYTRNSFRGRDLWFRRRYFREQDNEFLIAPTVIEHVSFRQGNILDASFSPASAPYDFIFCRNLLIYLEVQKRQQALGRLEEWLMPDGLLFVGPAEQPLLIANGFRPTTSPLAFAHGKPAVTATAPQQMPNRVAPGATTAAPLTRGQSASTDAHSFYQEARRLATLGRHAEAATACTHHLRENPTSADTWHLLGSISDALGLPASLDYYRKAIYLQPDHEPALLCLAIVAEREGDHGKACAYRSRAERARSRRPAS